MLAVTQAVVSVHELAENRVEHAEMCVVVVVKVHLGQQADLCFKRTVPGPSLELALSSSSAP